MNSENPKSTKPNFVLNDIVKRKILDMYKISKDKPLKNTKETEKSESQNDDSQNN